MHALFTDEELLQNAAVKARQEAKKLEQDLLDFSKLPKTIEIGDNTWELYFIDLQTGDLSDPTIEAYQNTWLEEVYMRST